MKTLLIFCSISALCFTGFAIPRRIVRDNENGQIQFSQCTEGNVFTVRRLKMRCKNGVPEPVACLGSETVNQEIPVNTTKTIDGFWYKCQVEGTRIKYSEERRCRVNDKVYHVNDTIRDSNVIFQCQENAIIPVGCFYTDSNGKVVETKVGQTVLVDNVQHQCGGGPSNGQGTEKYANQTDSGDLGCSHQGKSYKPGEKWDNGKGFMYTCTKDGRIAISDCILEQGVTLAVNKTLVKDGFYHRCLKTEKGFAYQADPCNVTVVCEGPNAGKQIDNPNILHNSQQNGNGAATECIKNKKSHKLNESWSENGFKYICQSNGSVNVTACVADDGTEIPAGQTVVKNQLQHQCTFVAGGIRYLAKVCGAQVDCGKGESKSSGK